MAPAIDPKETSAVDNAQAFGGVLGTALARGLEPPLPAFDRATQIFGLARLKKGDIVREVLVINGEKRRSITIRVRAEDGGKDVIILSGKQEGDVKKAFFYVTSSEGQLSSAYYLESGVQVTRLDARQHVDVHRREVEFWRKWEQDVHRKLDEQD